jgi:hypothetical protein
VSRPYRQARSWKAIQRELIRDTAAFLWLLFLAAVTLPILFAPAPVAP